jgi:hypothetical protein
VVTVHEREAALRPGPQITILLRSSGLKSLIDRVNTHSLLPRLVVAASALAPMEMPAAATTAASTNVLFMMRTPMSARRQNETGTMNASLTTHAA